MNSQLPVEVELIYEVMPCNALRYAQEPIELTHPCTYFRKWGSYHSYDYPLTGAPQTPGIQQDAGYVGRANLVPEVLSGCRKAPILSLGINPNLPAFWPGKMNSVYPLFDTYQQYAHYFRYRSVAKLDIPEKNYEAFGGNKTDNPFSTLELTVPANKAGEKIIPTELQSQQMYLDYQDLLFSLADTMQWDKHNLSVGEDLSYGNMVACASAKWTLTADPQNPKLPPMTTAERDGIVQECFFKRRYFVRQLLQSLPRVILIFSQTTANAFISTFKGSFLSGSPATNESLDTLIDKKVTLKLGTLPDGSTAVARVIFAPHATGDPKAYAAVKPKIIAQLVEEAQAGHISFNKATGHLGRPPGNCSLCPMMEIGQCDYESEITSLTEGKKTAPQLTLASFAKEKAHQQKMLDEMDKLHFTPADWK